MIKLYVSGYVGNLGTKVLIDEKQDELVKQFNHEFITHIKNQIEESLSEGGFNPSLIMSSRGDEVSICRGEQCEPDDLKIVDSEPIAKGGILTALWKLCDRNKWGLRYSLREIPILQGTVEIANYFDINPYRLLTKNSYIIACGDDEKNCRGELCEHEKGRGELCEPEKSRGELCEPSLIYIGDITNTKKRVRIDGEAEAFLTKDYKDEIDKIIKGYTKSNG